MLSCLPLFTVAYFQDVYSSILCSYFLLSSKNILERPWISYRTACVHHSCWNNYSLINCAGLVDQSKRPFLHMATQHMETPLNIPCYIGIQTRGLVDWKIEDFIQPILLLVNVMSILLVHCDKVEDKKEDNRKNKDRKIRRINMLRIFREKT